VYKRQVLQNLGLSWYPRWHYAVVIGYDLHAREIVLRSGTERRHVISIDRFERTWARSGHWTLAVLPPDRLPATAQEQSYLRSIADLEALGNPRPANTAYAAAIARWPQSTLAWMGFGNTAYAMNRYRVAEAAFRRALELEPDYAPALNNLAQLLSEREALAEAEAFVQRAIEIDGGRTPIYERTLAEIRSRRDSRAEVRATE
jgi:tetratricopeptide (TPR) repeat protein